METKYYRFLRYPLELAANPIPGEFVSGSSGTLYYVDSDYILEPILDSPMNSHELLETLTETQYCKLYCKILINKLVKLGYVVK